MLAKRSNEILFVLLFKDTGGGRTADASEPGNRRTLRCRATLVKVHSMFTGEFTGDTSQHAAARAALFGEARIRPPCDATPEWQRTNAAESSQSQKDKSQSIDLNGNNGIRFI